MIKEEFFRLFNSKKPIIGMIHLAPGDSGVVEQAHKEMRIYEEYGVSGVIIENYHGTKRDVLNVLESLKKRRSEKLVIGINILPNEFSESIGWAKRYGAGFVQLDYVSGDYLEGELDYPRYLETRAGLNISVLGGVFPKYYHPRNPSKLSYYLNLAKQRAEAVVVTGNGTGKETPIEKIIEFRETLGNDYPLVIGAGINLENAKEQLKIADGAIVGSFFKNNDTWNLIDETKVSELMDIVNGLIYTSGIN
ncbi:BtpA family protein [uncultured archaeon]|nr:BtpA family protein [uncultured archaeon]